MKNKAAKFMAVFVCVCVALAGTLSAAAYIFDPQNVYRWNENGSRYFNPTYSAAGAVQHYDYDMAIIGSSMVQNLSAESIAKSLDCKPVKLTIGAMTPNELLFLYGAAQQKGSAKRYIINLDLHRIASVQSVKPDSGRFPSQMFSPGGISQFKYLLGFETWFRFMPLDMAISAANAFKLPLPSSVSAQIKSATDINAMCEMNLGALPGREKIVEQYQHGVTTFNEGDSNIYTENAVKNIETIFEYLKKDLDESESITIILPPYSVLYWACKSNEQNEILSAMRQRIAELADENKNIRVLDFQSLEQTTDLDSYYDMSHYSPEIRAVIEAALSTDEYEVNTEKIAENTKRIRSNTEKCRLEFE